MEFGIKALLARHVIDVADDHGLDNARVKEIITGYLSYLRDVLASGHRVVIVGLVTIVPDYEVDISTHTLAYDCAILADRLGTPYLTVFYIVRAYIQDLIDDLMVCRPVDLRGVANFHPIKNVDGVMYTIHANSSASLKTYFEKVGSPVSRVRLYTHPILRNKVREAGGTAV